MLRLLFRWDLQWWPVNFCPDCSSGSYWVGRCSREFISPHGIRCSFIDGCCSFIIWFDFSNFIFYLLISNLYFFHLKLAVFMSMRWLNDWKICKKSKTLHPWGSGSYSHMKEVASKCIGIFFWFAVELLSLLLFNSGGFLLNFTVNISILDHFPFFEFLLFLI